MYGIDFGTSNTVVTARDGGTTRLLDLGEGGIVPSLLYFERDRKASIGAEAILDYTEALAKWKGSGNLYSHFRFFQALKLALKDPAFTGTTIFGERMRRRPKGRAKRPHQVCRYVSRLSGSTQASKKARAESASIGPERGPESKPLSRARA